MKQTKWVRNLFLAVYFLINVCSSINVFAENLIELPMAEGSKRFDMKINNLNQSGIKYFLLNELDKAEENLRKAVNIAQQFRDPSLGIVSFNRALILHKLNKKKYAFKYFNLARKYARGNPKILNSRLFKDYVNQ